MERVMGIEPTSSAWEAEVLPLNNTREVLPLNYTHPGPRLFDYHSGADVAQQPAGISTIGTDPGVIFGSCFRSVRRTGSVRSSFVVTAYRSLVFPQTGPELRTPGGSDDKGPAPGT